MRLALTQGLHREMPAEELGQNLSERWRNAWWTVYILDSKFSSLMGNPPSIHDEDITVGLPPQGNAITRNSTLGLHVELSRLIARVLNSKGSQGVIC